MKFFILKTTNPYINLAIEEYLFSSTNDDIFMLWQNEPTIVIGKNQNPFSEINMNFVKENGIHIARRITGGGAVYHDLGNVNYTFISKQKEDGQIDFEYFTMPILESLKSNGIPAILSGRNDLLVDGKKFSGNAQHTHDGRVLHHGTLLFDTDLDILTLALKVDPDKIKSKAIQSTRSRVTNLKRYFPQDTNAADFINLISEHVQKQFNAEISQAPICKEVDELAKRNASEEWLFPKSSYLSTYTVTKKQKYDFGIVKLELNMSNDKVTDIKITGDFFGNKDISILESLIKNKSIGELCELIEQINVSDFIFNMKNEELLDLIRK